MRFTRFKNFSSAQRRAKFYLVTARCLAIPTIGMAAHRAEPPTPQDSRLIPVYQADRVWNGVTTAHDGRTFVSYPPAEHYGLQAEEILPDGRRRLYPDAAWNSWKPGADFARAFVHVNALRVGPDGRLWIVDAGAPGIGKPALNGAGRLVQVDLRSNKVTRVYHLQDSLRPKSYVDDLRFSGERAYITDAGDPALIILDLKTGATRRVLEGDASTTDRRPILCRR